MVIHKLCNNHKSKNEYRVKADSNRKFVLAFDNANDAMEVVNSEENIDKGGVLETELQEEIEKITPENIEEKSKKFLERFNKKFKLDVSYNPEEADIDKINDRAKKATWDKENRFLLNFHMMEVTKRKFNFPEWRFEKVNTFNHFYIPQYVGRNGSTNTYYGILELKTKKYFDFKLYLGL